MRDWKARLQKLVTDGQKAPEPLCDCFEARPPSTDAWPEGLPRIASLSAFYDLCDGGRMGSYDLLPRGEILGETGDFRGFTQPGEWDSRFVPAQSLVIGHHEYGHALVWETVSDVLGVYSPDDDGDWTVLKRPLGKFLERLFFPNPDRGGGTTELWREMLAELGFKD